MPVGCDECSQTGYKGRIGVFEAMAAGLPVVLCRTTASTEVLKDGENAFFVDPQNPEEIALKIKLLIDKPDIYKIVATNGQNLVREKLTWSKYTGKLLDLIKKNHKAQKS